MDEDRRVSIETISGQFEVSVGTVHIIHDELKIEDLREVCPQGAQSDPRVLMALVTCDESWIYCCGPETKRQSFQRKHPGSPRPKKVRQSNFTLKLIIIPFFDSKSMIYIHWVPSEQTVNKEYYVEALREFR
ncbi:uncharacterized protein LOC119586096 [Penaeus monodon]|uniref:uncharacterized protein LOC119586096 n=1 Tax=Penaeus monodon TaxID=6687 RepID=UPI0018A6E7F1|nr:uncharacterized protein LOC119586096 [Penaeus monodon]